MNLVKVLFKVRSYLEGRTYDPGDVADIPEHLVSEEVHDVVPTLTDEAAPAAASEVATSEPDATHE